MADPRRIRDVLLLDGLDEAFQGKSWHGPNLRGAVRGLPARQAEARPQPGRHNIYELTVHAAYWKYAVWRRLTGGERGSLRLAGEQLLPLSLTPDRRAWKDAVALLVKEHRRLREAVAALPASALGKAPKGGRETNVRLIRGIAAHDLYHAGQIQLLKRLVGR